MLLLLALLVTEFFCAVGCLDFFAAGLYVPFRKVLSQGKRRFHRGVGWFLMFVWLVFQMAMAADLFGKLRETADAFWTIWLWSSRSSWLIPEPSAASHLNQRLFELGGVKLLLGRKDTFFWFQRK